MIGICLMERYYFYGENPFGRVYLKDNSVDLKKFSSSRSGLWTAWNRYWDRIMPSDGSADVYPKVFTAGSYSEMTISYTPGKSGIKKGGHLLIGPRGYTIPFQVERPEDECFVSATYGVKKDGPEVEVFSCRKGLRLLLVTFNNPLLPGEDVNVIIKRWRVPFRTYKNAEIIIAEDKGDGIYRRLGVCPSFEVKSASFSHFWIVSRYSSDGDKIVCHITPMDGYHNRMEDFTGRIWVKTDGKKDAVYFRKRDKGEKKIFLGLPGIKKRVVFVQRGKKEWKGNSLPTDFTREGEKIYFGSIHGHNALCDGTGEKGEDGIKEYYEWGKEVEGLDFCALTNHTSNYLTYDAWTHKKWEMVQKLTERFNLPGEYVTLLGYEWAPLDKYRKWHNNIYFKKGYGPLYRGDESRSNTLEKLVSLLINEECIIVPHHPCAGIDWNKRVYLKYPHLFPVVEIYSHFGNSLEERYPQWPEGDTVLSALAKGIRFGFIASPDTHYGRPFLDSWAGKRIGLTAVFARELTRSAIYNSLKERFCYATTGVRIFLDFRLNDFKMGSIIKEEDVGKGRNIWIKVFGQQPIKTIEIYRNGIPIFTTSPENESAEIIFVDEESLEKFLISGRPSFCWYYTKIVQVDGEIAWSSPVYIEIPLEPNKFRGRKDGKR